MRHLKGWSFRALERELRSNLVCWRFTHFDAEATPDYSTFIRNFALLSPAVAERIHHRVVGVASERGVAHGDKLRSDTTVVESKPSPGREKSDPQSEPLPRVSLQTHRSPPADLGTGEPKIVRRRRCFDGRPADEGHDETMLVLYSRVPALA
jgi:IS5 family transposase